jgi:hypothetical protein
MSSVIPLCEIRPLLPGFDVIYGLATTPSSPATAPHTSPGSSKDRARRRPVWRSRPSKPPQPRRGAGLAGSRRQHAA